MPNSNQTPETPGYYYALIERLGSFHQTEVEGPKRVEFQFPTLDAAKHTRFNLYKARKKMLQSEDVERQRAADRFKNNYSLRAISNPKGDGALLQIIPYSETEAHKIAKSLYDQMLEQLGPEAPSVDTTFDPGEIASTKDPTDSKDSGSFLGKYSLNAAMHGEEKDEPKPQTQPEEPYTEYTDEQIAQAFINAWESESGIVPPDLQKELDHRAWAKALVKRHQAGEDTGLDLT